MQSAVCPWHLNSSQFINCVFHDLSAARASLNSVKPPSGLIRTDRLADNWVLRASELLRYTVWAEWCNAIQYNTNGICSALNMKNKSFLMARRYEQYMWLVIAKWKKMSFESWLELSNSCRAADRFWIRLEWIFNWIILYMCWMTVALSNLVSRGYKPELTRVQRVFYATYTWQLWLCWKTAMEIV